METSLGNQSCFMTVLPVLDLLNGVVVRGIAGRRSEYQPLRSQLTSEVGPLEVARALGSQFGFTRFYVADLDAILHQRPNWQTYQQLIHEGFELLIDAGIRSVDEAISVRNCGAEPIIGLESCPGPEVLAGIVAANPGAITFSLDLQQGRPMLPINSTWQTVPTEIVRQVVACGVTQIIVLDLADVGTSSGGGTQELCRELLVEFPKLELICGGGVRGINDLRTFESLGAKSILVASALHDGRLTPADLASIRA